MSIKLEWDVTAAPRDDDLPPSPPTHTLNQPNEVANHSAVRWFGDGRPRWLGRLAGLALLAAAAGGAVWYFTQTGWQNVNNDLAAAVSYEDQQAAQGATNLLLNVQDRGNMDWLAVRRDETLAKQAAPLPVPMLGFGPAALQVTEVTALDTEFMQVNVNRQFSTPDGQAVAFTLPQFYHHGPGGEWLRSAPPGPFWGNWLDWRGERLDIRYAEPDAAFVAQAAPALDKRLTDACNTWNGGCPSQSPVRLYLSGFVGSLEYNPLANVEVRIQVGATNSAIVTPADYFLSIPSPQIAGIPTDEAGRNLLTDYLAVRLIAALARHISTSPDGYFERTAQAIQALGLGRADPGYIVLGQRRRGPAGGTTLIPPGTGTRLRGQDRLASRVVSYTTLPGDTLDSIAMAFSTPAMAIARANRLNSRDPLPPGIKLSIPILTPEGAAP